MAINLSQTQMANREKEQSGSLASLDKIQLPGDILPSEKAKPVQQNVIFKLVKRKKGRTNLDNCCDNVLNPKTGKTERIWLLNGANSIWSTDIEHILKDKERYSRARTNRDIIFQNGILLVRSTDTLMLDFMRNHTRNVGKNRVGAGKYDFYEYKPQEEQEERRKKQLLKISMINKANEMEIEKAKKLASFFGISFVDELGQKKSDDGIRTELMILADNDPSRFQMFIESKEVEVSYLVKRAIIDAHIDLTAQMGTAIWSKGKGFIARIPVNRKAYEYLTELALINSDEGKQFKEQLEKVIT